MIIKYICILSVVFGCVLNATKNNFGILVKVEKIPSDYFFRSPKSFGIDLKNHLLLIPQNEIELIVYNYKENNIKHHIEFDKLNYESIYQNSVKSYKELINSNDSLAEPFEILKYAGRAMDLIKVHQVYFSESHFKIGGYVFLPKIDVEDSMTLVTMYHHPIIIKYDAIKEEIDLHIDVIDNKVRTAGIGQNLGLTFLPFINSQNKYYFNNFYDPVNPDKAIPLVSRYLLNQNQLLYKDSVAIFYEKAIQGEIETPYFRLSKSSFTLHNDSVWYCDTKRIINLDSNQSLSFSLEKEEEIEAFHFSNDQTYMVINNIKTKTKILKNCSMNNSIELKAGKEISAYKFKNDYLFLLRFKDEKDLYLEQYHL